MQIILHPSYAKHTKAETSLSPCLLGGKVIAPSLILSHQSTSCRQPHFVVAQARSAVIPCSLLALFNTYIAPRIALSRTRQHCGQYTFHRTIRHPQTQTSTVQKEYRNVQHSIFGSLDKVTDIGERVQSLLIVQQAHTSHESLRKHCPDQGTALWHCRHYLQQRYFTSFHDRLSPQACLRLFYALLHSNFASARFCHGPNYDPIAPLDDM